MAGSMLMNDCRKSAQVARANSCSSKPGRWILAGSSERLMDYFGGTQPTVGRKFPRSSQKESHIDVLFPAGGVHPPTSGDRD